MVINLQEIPESGKQFICNRNTAELNETLKDLIGNADFIADFTIRPLNDNNYELFGGIETLIPETCSRCALDIKIKIKESFREFMMPKLDTPRDAKFAKVNHVSDLNNEGPSVWEYEGHHFNAGEYLHEVVGLAIPFNPAPPADENEKCVSCKIDLKKAVLSYSEDMEKPESPFAALKSIKLN